MPNRIKITINFNLVAANQFLTIIIQNTSPFYSNTQGFTFVTGVPAFSNQIRIGATAADTLNNLYDRFLITFSNLIVTKEFPHVYIDFPIPGDYTVTTLQNTTGGALSVAAESFTPVVPIVVDEFEIADLSIQIIDTYDNDRTLDVEITRQSAPK